MKIQRYLKTQSDRYAGIAAVLLIVLGVLVSYVPRSLPLRIAFAVIVLVVVGAAFWSLFEIRCPNCSKPLGITGFLGAVTPPREPPRRCPHCDIGFDSEIPTG